MFKKVRTDLRKLVTERMKKIVPSTKLNPECRNILLFTNTTRQTIRAKNKYCKHFCCKRTAVNSDNYKEKRNAVKTATRNDQRVKESEKAKDFEMNPTFQKNLELYETKNCVTKCNTSFNA